MFSEAQEMHVCTQGMVIITAAWPAFLPSDMQHPQQ